MCSSDLEALPAVDHQATVRWLARAFGVPAELLRPEGGVASAPAFDAASPLAGLGTAPLAATPVAEAATPMGTREAVQDVVS